MKRDCTSCDHYLKIDKPPYVMRCTFSNSHPAEMCEYETVDWEGCVDHTKLDQWAAEDERIQNAQTNYTAGKQQVLACAKCGNEITALGCSIQLKDRD